MMNRSCRIVVSSLLSAALLGFALPGSARAQDKPEDVNKAREVYKAAAAKANQKLIDQYAKKEWASAKGKADEAEAKAKAGENKKAVELFNRAAKETKEAIDLAAYADASKSATAVADAKKAKENFEKSKPIVATLEKEKDLYAARDQLAMLEDLIPKDPRMPGFREKVKALPIPKQTQFTIGRYARTTIKLVQIPAGKFIMGSPDTEKDRAADEGPQREVTISKPFYMSVYEINMEQFSVGANRQPFYDGPPYPAVDLTRDDALRFCAAASDADAKRTVRLPTEAEWEYACRANTKTRYFFGDDAAGNDFAWTVANSDGQVHLVGQKKPNPFGLYDTHGSVFEWVADNYAETYPAEKATDPKGPSGGYSYLARGGSWRCNPLLARSAYRYILPPNFQADDIGFRIVVTWDLESK